MDELILLYQEITQYASQFIQHNTDIHTIDKEVAGQVLRLTISLRPNTSLQYVKLSQPSIRLAGCLSVCHHGLKEIFVVCQEEGREPVILSLRHGQDEQRFFLSRSLHWLHANLALWHDSVIVP